MAAVDPTWDASSDAEGGSAARSPGSGHARARLSVLAQLWVLAGVRFGARSARERAIALVLALSLATVAADRVLLHPIQARLDALEHRAQALRPGDAGMDGVKRAEDAATQHRRELAAELAQVDSALDALNGELVAPSQTKQLVEGLIAGLPGLRLVQLRNEPPLALDGAVAGASGGAAPAPAGMSTGRIYRHGFELTVEGSYPELVQYLDRLESAPQRIFWRRVEFDASGYPAVRMVIQIYTLSRDPTWLVL